LATEEVDCDVEDEDWGLQADWTFEENPTLDERWDVEEEESGG